MKTRKFLAMLLAAFAMTVATACGDDKDDEPELPDTPSGAVGELRIGNEVAKIAYGEAYGPGYDQGASGHVEIILRGEENPNSRVETYMMIDVIGVSKDAQGFIPSGTYPYETDVEWNEEVGYTSKCYSVFNGALNVVYGENGPTRGYTFYGAHGCGTLTIARSGDVYTLTISKLVLDAENLVTNERSIVETSFVYQGRLDSQGQEGM